MRSSSHDALRAASTADVITFPGLCRWIGLIGILTIAVLRCLVVYSPQVAFDVDPALDWTAVLGLGPAGSLLLDALLLGACALALAGEWLSGHGLNGVVLAMALAPAPVVLWHGSHDAGNMWMGSTWLAGAIACATVAHLARDRILRTIIVAVLVAACIPVLMRGVVQIAHEHPQTLQFFEDHKDEFLRQRGWEPGSASAQIYERRLRQPQPTGWFISPNVFGSMMASLLVLSAGLGIAAARSRLQSGWTGAMSLCTLAAGTMLWLTGSKGAALAAIAASVILIPAALGGDSARQSASRVRTLAIALTLLALAAVVVRGVVLPEHFAGDKSLLFRWHYLVASIGVFGDAPWLGVGPDAFQSAYTVHRVPRNPEEVMSAHSVFIDWLCTLGITASAWIAMVAIIIGRTPPDLAGPAVRAPGAVEARAATRAAIAVALLAQAASMYVEWPAIDGVGLLARLLGVAGFVGFAWIAASIASHIHEALFHRVVLAAVTALLMHGQIEMTFTQPGAAVWAMCVIGALALPPMVGRGSRAVFVGVVILVLVIAAWIAAGEYVPAKKQQNAMLAAARALQGLRADRIDGEQALARRRAASDALIAAHRAWPVNVAPLEAAADQLVKASAHAPAGEPTTWLLLSARDLIEQAIAGRQKSSSMTIGVGINMRLAMQTADPQYWEAAIDGARLLTERDPNGLGAWRRYGDVLWAAGRRAEAKAAYRRALECDANFELDPLKQLPASERQRIAQRLEEPS